MLFNKAGAVVPETNNKRPSTEKTNLKTLQMHHDWQQHFLLFSPRMIELGESENEKNKMGVTFLLPHDVKLCFEVIQKSWIKRMKNILTEISS